MNAERGVVPEQEGRRRGAGWGCRQGPRPRARMMWLPAQRLHNHLQTNGDPHRQGARATEPGGRRGSGRAAVGASVLSEDDPGDRQQADLQNYL